jgi:insulysin
MDMEVPFTDTRLYQHLTLPNGLNCLLIEDVNTEKAAAAMGVCVGQMQDGHLPGLAHLTGNSCTICTRGR